MTHDQKQTRNTHEQDELTALRQRVSELEATVATLQQREQQLQLFETLVEKSIDSITLANFSGQVLYANQAALHMNGYTSLAALQARETSSFFVPAERQRIEREIIPHLLKHGTWQGHLWAVRADGSPYLVHNSSFVLTDDQNIPRALAGFNRDVTAWHEAEQEREQQAAKLRTFYSLVENAPDGIVVFDLDGRITYVNRSLQTFSGYDDTLIGQPISNLFSDDPPYVQHALNETHEHGTWQGTLTCQRRDSSTFTGQVSTLVIHDEHQHPLALAGIVHDITERLQIEATLRQNQNLLQAVIDYSPSAIYVKDLQGRYLLINQLIVTAIQRTPDEILGKTDYDLFPAHLVEAWRDHEQQAIASGTGITREEINLHAGEQRVYIESKFPLYDAQGTVYATGGIATDITERKRTEEALHQSQNLLQAVIDHSPAVIYVKDTSGRYIITNHRHATLLNRERSQILGKTDYDLFPARFAQSWYASDQQVLISGKSLEIEEIVPLGSGLYTFLSIKFPISNDQGIITAIAGVVTDITARKEAEELLRRSHIELEQRVLERTRALGQANRELQTEIAERQRAEVALRASEERYRIISELVSDFAYAFRIEPDGTLQCDWITDAATRILGRSSEELEARGWGNQVHPDDTELVWNTHRRLLHNETVVCEFRILTGNGELRWLRSHAWPEWDEQQQRVVRLYGAARDITEHKQAEAALRASEERYRIISELVSDFAYAFRVEPDGTPKSEWITSAAAHILGHSSEELDTHGWVNMVYPDDTELAWDNHRRLLQGKTSVCEYRIVTSSGEIRWLRHHSRPEWDEQQQRVVRIYGAARDITERKQAEEQIRRQVQYLSALRQIDMAIMASFDINLTLSILLDHVTFHLHVAAATVMVLDATTWTLHCVAARGFRTSTIQQVSVRPGEGCTGRVVLERRKIHIPDTQAPDEHCTRRNLLHEENLTSYYGVPLITKGQIKGVLELFHHSPFDPEPAWHDFLDMMSGQAAIAIDNAELLDNLQRANDNLTRAYDATIEGWAHALELRDVDTEGHTRRVTTLTVKLAQAMDLRDSDLIHIRRGAILHDIGKMAIPDRILLKAGPLDPDEWEKMREHPRIAYRLLSNIPFLRPALDIPHFHHERWDGSGYPQGLQGIEIPLAARIFAVVDVWDALLSDRPYRTAWSVEQVKQHIQEQAGSHFDPQIVAAFLTLINQEQRAQPTQN